MNPRQVRRLYRRLDGRRVPLRPVALGEAAGLLRGLPPDEEVVVLTLTEARELGPNPFGPCTVLKRRAVLLNQDYEAAVNARRLRERRKPTFTAARRPWGFQAGAPFVVHATEAGPRLYLAMHVVRNLGTEFFGPGLTPLPFDAVAPFLRPPRPHGRQGVTREVQYRNYDLLSVLAVVRTGPRGGRRGFILEVDPRDARRAARAALNRTTRAGVHAGTRETP